MALGAFVAGLVVNESEYAHQALSDVIPLRDLFGMLFFVSVGMLLDPGARVAAARRPRARRPRDRRRQGRDPGRRRARVRLPECRAAGGRPDAVSGRRVCVRPRPRRPVERSDFQRRLHADAEHRDRHDGAHARRVEPGAGRLRAFLAASRPGNARSHQPPVRRDCRTTWSSRGPAASAAASPMRCRS